MNKCPDCQASPGELHLEGCDVERCQECGSQYISCGCKYDILPRLPWVGEWPGVMECREFGWYSKMTNQGWVSCDNNDKGATEDLNKLCTDAIWDKKQGRFILPAEFRESVVLLP